jgi:hypothetical protein
MRTKFAPHGLRSHAVRTRTQLGQRSAPVDFVGKMADDDLVCPRSAVSKQIIPLSRTHDLRGC